MLDVSVLLGRRLEQVVKHACMWQFAFSDAMNLNEVGLWRLLISGKLKFTSEDHGHQFGLPAPVDCIAELHRELGGVAVTDCVARVGTTDLSISFGDNAMLEVIATSGGYENWVLNGGPFVIVGQPGYE